MVEFGANGVKVHKKTCLVPLEEEFSSYNQENKHQKPLWAKNVMQIFVREPEKAKSFENKTHMQTRTYTHTSTTPQEENLNHGGMMLEPKELED